MGVNMKKNKYYYAAQSAHGSESSHGFSNDIEVFVFRSFADRKKFLQMSLNISIRPILRREATKSAANYNATTNKIYRPDVFKGEYWGIDTQIADAVSDRCRVPVGLLYGVLVVAWQYSNIEPFYN